MRLLQQEPTIKAYTEEQERLKLNQERLMGDIERLRASSQHLKDNAQRLNVKLASTRAQLRALQKAQKTLGTSRAYRLANAYVQLATGQSLVARTLQLLRPAARALNQIRRALSSKL